MMARQARQGVAGLLTSVVLMLVTPSATGAGVGRSSNDADRGLVGVYFLRGVREVGGELLLMPQGRFSFALAYGAVDATASGQWAVQGDKATLTARGTTAPRSYLQRND